MAAENSDSSSNAGSSFRHPRTSSASRQSSGRARSSRRPIDVYTLVSEPGIVFCEVLQGVRDEFLAKDVERRLLKLAVFETRGVDLAREAVRRTKRGTQ